MVTNTADIIALIATASEGVIPCVTRYNDAITGETVQSFASFREVEGSIILDTEDEDDTPIVSGVFTRLSNGWMSFRDIHFGVIEFWLLDH